MSRIKIHAVLADIVQPADKRTNKIGAGLGGHDRLRRRKDEGDVDPNPFVAECFRGFQTFLGHRTLHHDVRVKLRKVAAFFNHSCRIRTHRFRTDGTIDDRADLQELLLEYISFLGNKAGIGRNAIQNAGAGYVADFVEIGSIQRKIS